MTSRDSIEAGKNEFYLSRLREPGLPPNERPTSGPEIDDLDPGIDDGLLPRNKPPDTFPKSPFPEYVPEVLDPRRVDVNVYQHKKTLAQGMMDLALLSANANQLRYLLEAGYHHPYFIPSMIMISLSLILQIVVGVGLICNSRYNVKEDRDIVKANRINNYTVLGIFLITITNVFVSAFGVAPLRGVEPMNLEVDENFTFDEKLP